MSESADFGHREMVTDLPTPLGGRHGLLGNWALPADALSILSMLALVLVPALLLVGDRMRALFRLPVPPGAAALVASAVAAVVLTRCRNRPGRNLARYWVLVLTGGAAVVAAMTLFGLPPRPWSDALALGLVAASWVLLARLLELHPDSSWLPVVGPASTFAVLLLVLLPSWLYGRAQVGGRASDLDGLISQLQDGARQVRLAEACDWSSFAADPEAAAEVAGRLRLVSLDGDMDAEATWQAARVLGRDDRLADATAELMQAVREAVESERGPRLAADSEPPVRWDRERGDWIANPDFPLLSTIVGTYYSQLGRLGRELDRFAAALPGTAGRLGEEMRRQDDELGAWRRDTAELWGRDWVVRRYESWTPADGDRELSSVLRTKLAPDGPRAADVADLMALKLERMDRLAERSAGCHRRAYVENGVPYERLDCYAFRPAKESLGAEPRIELRIVYRGRGTYVPTLSTPVEIYFLFPIPQDRDPAEFGSEVISELAQAIDRAGVGAVYASDRGGSVVNGFSVRTEERSIRVTKPSVVGYVGSRKAIEVRCE